MAESLHLGFFFCFCSEEEKKTPKTLVKQIGLWPAELKASYAASAEKETKIKCRCELCRFVHGGQAFRAYMQH